MIKTLRFKILAGFMLLIAMLVVAGAMAIYQFTRLSRTVNELIDNNYKTILAGRTMLESLEREDSGILLLLLGHYKDGRAIINQADSAFSAAFHIARNNITEEGEEENILAIEQAYRTYREEWQKPVVDTYREGNITWYQGSSHQFFLKTKAEVNRLMELNQESMYREATDLRDKSHRAIMPGIITILSALVFTLLLNFFISKYFVWPILHLSEAVRTYKPELKKLRVTISSEDEIRELAEQIQGLIDRTVRHLKANGQPNS